MPQLDRKSWAEELYLYKYSIVERIYYDLYFVSTIERVFQAEKNGQGRDKKGEGDRENGIETIYPHHNGYSS